MKKWFRRIASITCLPEVVRQLRLIGPEINARPTIASSFEYSRGVDFYPRPHLIFVLSRIFLEHRRKFGKFPSLFRPETFNEKLIRKKFLGYFRVPFSGDKIETRRLVPDAVQCVKFPAVVWASEAPVLPSNETIPPGTYYLKANHGSNMYRRVAFPLSEPEREELNAVCEEWLRKAFGYEIGEWWYCSFSRKVFLEADVCGEAQSFTYNLFVFDGSVKLAYLIRKGCPGEKGGLLRVLLDQDFCVVDTNAPGSSAADAMLCTPDQRDRMIEAASRIGKGQDFVRVDFLIGSDGDIYLGELTFCPGSGLTERPKNIDMLLSSSWPSHICVDPEADSTV